MHKKKKKRNETTMCGREKFLNPKNLISQFPFPCPFGSPPLVLLGMSLGGNRGAETGSGFTLSRSSQLQELDGEPQVH